MLTHSLFNLFPAFLLIAYVYGNVFSCNLRKHFKKRTQSIQQRSSMNEHHLGSRKQLGWRSAALLAHGTEVEGFFGVHAATADGKVVEVAWYELLPVASCPCNACLQLESSEEVQLIFSLGEMVTSVTPIQQFRTMIIHIIDDQLSLRFLYFSCKDTLNQSNETIIHLNTVLLNVHSKIPEKKDMNSTTVLILITGHVLSRHQAFEWFSAGSVTLKTGGNDADWSAFKNHRN